jgi:hypothetical protein
MGPKLRYWRRPQYLNIKSLYSVNAKSLYSSYRSLRGRGACGRGKPSDTCGLNLTVGVGVGAGVGVGVEPRVGVGGWVGGCVCARVCVCVCVLQPHESRSGRGAVWGAESYFGFRVYTLKPKA